MRKEIFFGRSCGQNIAVVTDDGNISELDFEGEGNENLVGTVYKARVMNVLPGMQAAFVYCGLERNCYLSTDDGPIEESDSKFAVRRKENLLNLKVGDEIMVQVTKPPVGNKGAKVTTKISYVGKSVVYIPNDTFMGVSRKIEDEELRDNLIFTMNSLKDREDEGMIIRTGAPNFDRKTLKKELDWLRRIDKDVRNKYKEAKAGDVLYKDEDVFHRTLRDVYTDKIYKIYVNDEEHYKLVRSILSLYGDGSEKKVVLYNGERDMLLHFGLLNQIINTLKPNVPLKSGGYLVIERTEAMTVIDVNTGKYIGGENLEETVYRTNIEAAAEIARQVRLRNIGGIVAVDFIDMTSDVHKNRVTAALNEALSHDKTKCHVLPMSDFCVTEFTRKRLKRDMMASEMKPCPRCEHSGYLLSDSMCAIKIQCAISDCFACGYKTVIAELNAGILKGILSNRWYTSCLKNQWKGKKVYMIPHKTYSEEYYTVRGDDSGVLSLPDNAQLLY